MKESDAAKAKLLSELKNATRQNPEDKTIISLREIISKINSLSELNGGLSKIVNESLDFKLTAGESIIAFENYFLNKTS